MPPIIMPSIIMPPPKPRTDRLGRLDSLQVKRFGCECLVNDFEGLRVVDGRTPLAELVGG